MSSTAFSGEDGRPNFADLEGDNEWTQLARKHWLGSAKLKRVKNDVVKIGIWDVLEKENFQYRSLLILESLQLLEMFV